MRLPFKQAISPEEKRLDMLRRTYAELIERLNDIRTMFDFATDSAMIDALIFEENAVLSRLEQVYKDARAEGIALPVYNGEKTNI